MSGVRDPMDELGIVLQSHRPGNHRAACPLCNKHKHRPGDTALAVRIDERGIVAICHRCGWTVARSSEGPRWATKSAAPRPATPDTSAERIEAARKLWSEARPIAETVGEKYLRRRGIPGLLPGCLRYHPACWHSELRARRPAMLALMQDIASNAVCGVHRTYLAADGSGKITDATAKKMLGRAKRAAVKLTPDEEITLGLAICEGIETGLSIPGWPVWVVGSAGSISDFPLLSGIECLTVFADADETGHRAAEACARRWAAGGHEAQIVSPKAFGDWNDWRRSA